MTSDWESPAMATRNSIAVVVKALLILNGLFIAVANADEGEQWDGRR